MGKGSMRRASRLTHITDVSIPDLPLGLADASMADALSEVGGQSFDVFITFGDRSTYQYPDVPAGIALAVQKDPEGSFPQIRFWPGYRKIAAAPKQARPPHGGNAPFVPLPEESRRTRPSVTIVAVDPRTGITYTQFQLDRVPLGQDVRDRLVFGDFGTVFHR